MSRENNPLWKGGRYRDTGGYWHLLTEAGYRLEHRVVMERKLGRSLLPTEVVHHRNENREDNSPENLKLYAEPGRHILENHAKRCQMTGKFQSLRREDGRQT
jgi:hypothetical protein